MNVCAARLEQDQTKRGSDVLLPVLHSISLRGNRRRDAPPLRHCAVDAEHPVSASFSRGSGFHALGTCATGRVQTRPLKHSQIQRSSAPYLTVPPKLGSVERHRNGEAIKMIPILW